MSNEVQYRKRDAKILRKPFPKIGSQANFVAKYIMYSKADCLEHCVASEISSWKQIEMGEYLHLDVGGLSSRHILDSVKRHFYIYSAVCALVFQSEYLVSDHMVVNIPLLACMPSSLSIRQPYICIG